MFISAAITPGGSPGRILAALVERQAFSLVLSPAIVMEFDKTIRSRKLRRYIPEPTQPALFITGVLALADVVPDTRRVRGVCRDPGDDAVLSAGVEGRASIIVTGDGDLLALGDYEGIAIVSPRAFLVLMNR